MMREPVGLLSCLEVVEDLHLHVIPMAVQLMLAWTVEVHLGRLILRIVDANAPKVGHIKDQLAQSAVRCIGLSTLHVYSVVVDANFEILIVYCLVGFDVHRRLVQPDVLQMLGVVLVL
jgi:hypothetical protein